MKTGKMLGEYPCRPAAADYGRTLRVQAARRAALEFTTPPRAKANRGSCRPGTPPDGIA